MKMEYVCIVMLFISVTPTHYFQRTAGDEANIWTTSSFKFIQATQLKFCGTRTKLCNPYNSSELIGIYNEVKKDVQLLEPHENWTIDEQCCDDSCSCNWLDCAQHGTCCMDVLNQELIHTEEYGMQECSTAQLRTLANHLLSSDRFWTIRKCAKSHKSFTEGSVIDKCEHPENYNTLDVLIPVSDLFTNLTYRNVYCLRCNGATENNILHWTAKLECEDLDEASYIQGLTRQNFIAETWSTKTCNIIYKVPDESTFWPKYCSLVYTSCNITGNWRVYNAFLDLFCHTYTSKYNNVYKNIFCYMCNENKLPDHCAAGFPPPVFPLFSTLLKYNPTDYENIGGSAKQNALCKQSQVFDSVQKMCRNISCRFPKKERDGHCVDMVETVAGMKLMVYLALSPQDTILESESFNIFLPLSSYVFEKVVSWGLESSLYNFTILYKSTQVNITITEDDILGHPITSELPEEETSAESKHSDNWVGSVAGPGFLPLPTTYPEELNTQVASSLKQTVTDLQPTTAVLRTDATVSVYDYFLFKIGIFIPTTHKHLNVSLLGEILSANGENVSIISFRNQRESFTQRLLDLSSVNFMCGGEVTVNDRTDTSGHKILPIVSPFNFVQSNGNTEPITVSHSLTCPLVHMGTIDNATVACWDGKVAIYGQEINPAYTYVQKDTSTDVFVCFDAFKEALAKFTKSSANIEKVTTVPSVKEIFSLVCVCVSVICASLTLLTYSLFMELRTQPGLNNMCLVINLIFAQVLFQFGVNQAELVPTWACKTIGLLVHFFWLNVIFWMNVCSVHMFKSFSLIRNLKLKKREHNLRTTAIYIVFNALSATMLVAINVTTANVLSDGADFGYGGVVCYISSVERIGYLFCLPVLAVVLVNICLLSSVVIKVSRMPSVTSRNISDRNYLAIYTKLASVTGATWITGFIFYLTALEVFEYIFILLNAGQGLLIFVSFICNKRVLGMCRSKFSGFSKNSQSGTISSPANRPTFNNTVFSTNVQSVRL